MDPEQDKTPGPPPRSWPDWRATLRLAIAVALGIGVVQAIGLVARPLELLVIAITVAEALAPLAERLAHRLHRRTLAIVLVYLAVLAGVVLLGWLVVPPLVSQGYQLASRAPDMVATFRDWASRWSGVTGEQMIRALGDWPGRLGTLIVSLPFQIFSTLVQISFVVFLSIYWLIGGPTIRLFTLSLVPEPRRDGADRVLREMGQAMGGYVRGAAINGLILGALAWVGLSLIGVPYTVMLAVLTMIGELVPVVGPTVVGGIVVGIALMHSLTKALIAAALYTALVQLEGHILTPNIMRRQTHVPQALVLFAIVVGAALGGLPGVLVSIPAAAALRVLVVRVLAPAERRLAEGGTAVERSKGGTVESSKD
jgi:predicted PurR-regulated permease PerM